MRNFSSVSTAIVPSAGLRQAGITHESHSGRPHAGNFVASSPLPCDTSTAVTSPDRQRHHPGLDLVERFDVLDAGVSRVRPLPPTRAEKPPTLMISKSGGNDRLRTELTRRTLDGNRRRTTSESKHLMIE